MCNNKLTQESIIVFHNAPKNIVCILLRFTYKVSDFTVNPDFKIEMTNLWISNGLVGIERLDYLEPLVLLYHRKISKNNAFKGYDAMKFLLEFRYSCGLIQGQWQKNVIY